MGGVGGREGFRGGLSPSLSAKMTSLQGSALDEMREALNLLDLERGGGVGGERGESAGAGGSGDRASKGASGSRILQVRAG